MKKEYKDIDLTNVEYTHEEILNGLNKFYNSIYFDELDEEGPVNPEVLFQLHTNEEQRDITYKDYLDCKYITYFVDEYEKGNIDKEELNELVEDNELDYVLNGFKHHEIIFWHGLKDFFYNIFLEEEQVTDNYTLKSFYEEFNSKSESEILEEYFGYPYSGMIVLPNQDVIVEIPPDGGFTQV